MAGGGRVIDNRAVYERQAKRYDRERGRSLFERPWLLACLRDVPPGGAVLDLGCGTGAPIGVWLAAQGYALTGVDFSPAMLALFRARLPQAEAREADIETLDLGRRFDAVIGWGSVFHLSRAAQRRALPRIAAHLNPGARLLLTVGPGAGEATGTVGGETVFHASLDIAEYRARLARHGLRVERFSPEDPECQGHSLLLARRAAGPRASRVPVEC
jgi:SAM-dependent methyltransferase